MVFNGISITCVYIPKPAACYLLGMLEDAPERALNSKRRLGGRARMDLLGHTVLLLEDDFCQARDIQQALQHAGAKVIGPFSDSESALQSVAARDPSCAILDIRSVDASRLEIASALKKRGVPMMFLSELDPSAMPEEFAGVPVMQKPVEYRPMLSLAARISSKRWV